MDVFNTLLQNQSIAMVLAGIFGLCVGSFLNVVIYRTPLIMNYQWRKDIAWYLDSQNDFDKNAVRHITSVIKEDKTVSLSFPPSTCPNCGHKIQFYENIPIISWLILRGRCADCQNPISIRYPFVECSTAILSALVIFVLGANLAGLFGLVYLWILIALTGIDFDTQLLPDRLVFPLGMFGLAVNTQNIFVSATSSMWGAIIGFLSLWSVASLYALITKKDGMGAGDFKLLGALGAWVGVGLLPLIILLSAVFGSVVGVVLMRLSGESKPFAFGPYIALGGIVALLWGNDIMQWYL